MRTALPTLSCTLLLLAVGWLAAPHASQKGASEGFIFFGAKQDLTDKPAVQDALVNFGYPEHPQPPTPAHHTLYPDEVTIFKGGTVTFTMHGMGHGIAIYPVSKNTTRAHIAEDLCQGLLARNTRIRRSVTLRTQRLPSRTQLRTGKVTSSSTSLNFPPNDKSTPLRASSSQQAGFQAYC